MASRRCRTQLISFTIAIAVIYFLFFNGDYSSSTTDFRRTTESALARKHGVLRGGLSDEDLTAQTNRELQAVLAAKNGGDSNSADGKIILEGTRKSSPTSQPFATTLSDDEVPVAGRKTMPKPTTRPKDATDALRDKERPRYPVDKSSSPASDNGEEVAFNGNKVETASDAGEEMAREELQSILKKSPIIIFSKSYCPYSKRAKALLLETYNITPAPFVVELDLMTAKIPVSDGDEDEVTLGRKLQDLLASLTGRKTVPNIMIATQSLGGSDDIAKLEREGMLAEEIKRLGGKRIVGVERRKKDGD